MLSTTRISRRPLIITFVALTLLFLIILKPHTYEAAANTISSYMSSNMSAAPQLPTHHPYSHANATLLMLARNSDLDGAVQSVRGIEDRFNKYYGYPWVFLNEEPFSDDFKKRISNLASGPVYFDQIPGHQWYQPSWIDENKATEERHKMEQENVIYGGSVPYRNMCRFNSGFFYRQQILQQFRYYWRVEPGVHFHCDVNFDPFVFMHENNKTYGFTISLYEFSRTIVTLWPTVRDFMNEYPQYIAPNNAMSFLSDNGGNDYNLCHFWSNFEIGDMDFWRGEAYSTFFEYLESRGGFYYERWGDAPVHSIGVSLLAGADRIHMFRDIGYEHAPFSHCPADDTLWEQGRCACDRGRNFDYDGYSCLSRWDRVEEGLGKR